MTETPFDYHKYSWMPLFFYFDILDGLPDLEQIKSAATAFKNWSESRGEEIVLCGGVYKRVPSVWHGRTTCFHGYWPKSLYDTFGRGNV